MSYCTAYAIVPVWFARFAVRARSELGPAAQNCPRSRTRLTPWLRRFSGAANAAGASEAGVLKTRTGERKSFAQS
jgi:hypothetical protein